MQITFSDSIAPKNDVIVVCLTDSMAFGAEGARLDRATGGALSRATQTGGFKAKKGQLLPVIAPSGVECDQILIVGMGEEKNITNIIAQAVGGAIVPALNKARAKSAAIVIEGVKNIKDVAAHVAYGAKLKSYHFSKYRTKQKDEDKPTITTFNVVVAASSEVGTIYKKLQKIADGIFLARDLVTEPPNLLYPASYAEIIKKELSAVGVTVKIFGEKQLERMGAGALLGVGQGSIRESQLVVMEYKGKKSSKDMPVAFVGKGVTFDTGGISLKPSAGMEDMKYDMGGSAVVVGLMKALAGRKAAVNAVGVVGLVENMPGDNAQRPSDVVTSMSGQTVEVLNTDAEGRLVLADALWYAQENYKPKYVIDLATLTGAIVIALGEEYAGLFSNSDELSEKLTAAGIATDEKLWRFPLGEAYDKLLDSPIADMQNISSERGAGSITAAQFLQRFIKEGVQWAHLDIAGVAWTKKDKDTCPKGATALGVRLLDKVVQDNFES